MLAIFDRCGIFFKSTLQHGDQSESDFASTSSSQSTKEIIIQWRSMWQDSFPVGMALYITAGLRCVIYVITCPKHFTSVITVM